MMKCGCIGKKLTHSFSKEIHARLADYRYDLIELTEAELPAFFHKREFDAINVTIPYKQTVIPYLDAVSNVAQRIGAVNTIVHRNGKLLGYNTDYHGMTALLEKAGITLSGKKVLILGTGGTSRTACVVAADQGAAQVHFISRQKSAQAVTYAEAMALHSDAQVIINTTPCGMYPNCDASPIDLSAFSDLQGVVDAVYNPLRTDLVLDAQARGIRAAGGLYMLVMQAVVAVEKFLGRTIDRAEADRVFAEIFADKENIVLLGTQENGLQNLAKALSSTGFDLIHTDAGNENLSACSLRDAAAAAHRIIVTGGCTPLREDDLHCLRRNGRLYCRSGSPFCAEADVTLPELPSPEAEAAYILRERMEMIL